MSSRCESINVQSIINNVFTNCKKERMTLISENKIIVVYNGNLDTLDVKVHHDTIFIISEFKTENENRIKFYTFKQIDTNVNNYLVHGYYYNNINASISRKTFINRKYILEYANCFDFFSVELIGNTEKRKMFFYKSRNIEILYNLNNESKKFKQNLTDEQYENLVEILYKSQIQFMPLKRKCINRTDSIKFVLKIWSRQYSSIGCELNEVQNDLLIYIEKIWNESLLKNNE